MQTRIEKWKLYRQEILNDGLMLDKLANESSVIQDYKLKIDELNPKILYDISTNSALSNLISIDLKKYSEIENLKEFSSLIDDQKLNTSSKEIEEYLSKSDFVSILDEKGKISNKWLSEDKNFLKIIDYEKKLKNLSNTWSTFQIVSKDQIDKLDDLIKSKKIYEEFQNYKIEELDESQILSRPFKTVYLISMIISLVMLVVLVIFLVFQIIYYA